MELRKFIKTTIREYLNEQLNVGNDNITVYHGTPFEKSAIGIKNNGLQQVGDFIVSGGDGSPSMNNRSYVAKDLWNAIRYSFFKPSSMNLDWINYINQYPFGYVFQFNIALSELLPDEDAIGAMVSEFLNKNENKFLSKYLSNINKDLLNNVKEGSYAAFAEIGKIIEPNLSNEDKKSIVLQSRTATINKPIKPTKSFKIRKPNTQFMKNTNDYVDWFNKNKQNF